MKHKIWSVLFVFSLAACGVELKDKNKVEAPPPGHKMEAEPTPVQEVNPLPTPTKPDFVIDGAVTLDKHESIQVHKLHLTKNALINTQDYNLLIVVDELISEGAVIQNFQENTAALWDKNGRSGGGIQIIAKKATGLLSVGLRGENGGHGKNGCITDPSVHPGCQGNNGGQGGSAGSLRAEIDDSSEFTLNWQNQAGQAGLAGKRGAVACTTPDVVAVHPPCYRENPDGVDGLPGNKGQVCLKMHAEDVVRCSE